MSIIKQLNWRYATKKFDPNKSLETDQVSLIKEAFNLTATSFGLQTMALVMIKDLDIRSQLLEHTYGQRQIVDASHLLVLCIHDDVTDMDIENHFDNVKDLRQTPGEILEPYKESLKGIMRKKTTEERQEWATRQVYIALGNLMTVCAVEYIDACPMEGFDHNGYSKVLDLESKGLKPVLLLPVGFRAEDDMFADFKKVRKGIANSVIEI